MQKNSETNLLQNKISSCFIFFSISDQIAGFLRILELFSYLYYDTALRKFVHRGFPFSPLKSNIFCLFSNRQLAILFLFRLLVYFVNWFNREKTDKFMFIIKLFIMLIDSWCLLHTRAIAAVTKDNRYCKIKWNFLGWFYWFYKKKLNELLYSQSEYQPSNCFTSFLFV